MVSPKAAIRKLPFLFLGAVLVAASVPAQEHTKSAPSLHKQPAPARVENEQAEGPGAELAEASREAAGEGENEEFRHSASVQWLARTLHVSTATAYWTSVVLNFAIIAVLVAFALRAWLPGIFRDRTRSIRKALDEARKASEEARQRLAAIESRLTKLQSEIAAMQLAAEQESRSEEERIRAAAEQDKRKIIAAAEQEIMLAANLARRELKTYVAELAVSLAQKRIQVNPATDEELVRSFVDQLAQNGNK